MRFFRVNAAISILFLSIILLTFKSIQVQAKKELSATSSGDPATGSDEKNEKVKSSLLRQRKNRPHLDHESSFTRMQRKKKLSNKGFAHSIQEKNEKHMKNIEIAHKRQEQDRKYNYIHSTKSTRQEESRKGRKLIDPFYGENVEKTFSALLPTSITTTTQSDTTQSEQQQQQQVEETKDMINLTADENNNIPVGENTIIDQIEMDTSVSGTTATENRNEEPKKVVVNHDQSLVENLFSAETESTSSTTTLQNQVVEKAQDFMENVMEDGLINTMKELAKEKVTGKGKDSKDTKEVPIVSKPKLANEKYNYAEILHLSILFYEAQRSGDLSEDENRIPWRGDAHVNDGSDIGKDLSGGWYDAGDHIKFTFPMAYSTTVLTWGLLEYWDGYKRSGELENILDCIKWPLDFLMKANIGNGEFVVQVGDGNTDHNYWGSPENMNSWRPTLLSKKSNPGGTEPMAEAAAALAAGYLAFKDEDPMYARDLLENAKDLFNTADTYRSTFTISEPYYKSWSGYNDELAWAATWLYKATGNRDYLRKAEQEYNICCYNTEGFGFSWDGKAPPVQIMLYKLTRKEKYKQGFEAYMNFWINQMRYTPKGLAFYSQWGSNRYAANTAFLGLVAADYGIGGSAGDREHPYRIWSQSQVHYILGDCCGGINPDSNRPYYSYIIGYGDDFPRSPHHRSSSCNKDDWSCGCSDQPNKNILYGAMVGGPGDQDNYNDNCQDYTMNEVATDYNAGITGAVAALKHLAVINKLPTKQYTPNPSNIIMKVVEDEFLSSSSPKDQD